MKKKTIALLTVCMIFLAAGCGKSDDNSNTDTETLPESGTESNTTAAAGIEYHAEDYVTMGDYLGVNVSLNEAEYQVTDDSVNEYADQMIAYTKPYVTDETKTVVGENDIVDVDYVGKKDGEPFEGGSAENQYIDVANNSSATGGTGFIEGFTDGLVGAKVGETVDCNVTFPEDYQAEELKGQAVVFTFTVNAIVKPVTRDVLDDTFVKDNFQVENVDEFYKSVRSYLDQDMQSKKDSDIRTAVIQKVMENCKVNSLPEGLLDERLEEYVQLFKKQYCSEGVELEDFLRTNYNMSVDEFYEENRTYMEENLNQEIVFEAIANREKIEFDQEGYDAYIQNIVSSGRFESVDALYEGYGSNKAAGEAYFNKIYMVNKACNMVVEQAKVNFTQGEAVEDTENSAQE